MLRPTYGVFAQNGFGNQSYYHLNFPNFVKWNSKISENEDFNIQYETKPFDII